MPLPISGDPLLMKNRFVILLILLLAFASRTYRLTEIPPGLTHDEANHGVEGMEVLDGELRFYFPRNYGSEPLYSYLVALTMWGGGENLLSLRLVNVWFGVLVIAAAYRLTPTLFKNSVPRPLSPVTNNTYTHYTALFAAATLTLTFWPLASSREALRAGVLPFLMTMAVILFWHIVSGNVEELKRTQGNSSTRKLANSQTRLPRIIPFALFIALTLHTYLAARVAWLVFPVFLGYLFVWHREWFWCSWKPVLVGLILAGVLAIPMFRYLQTNPYAETRLEMLDTTIQAARDGDFKPLLYNAGRALAAFVIPGFGDQFLAYNIPGRPVFDVLMGSFFLIGVGLSVWRWRQPAYALLLLWFVIGIAPSLITGPTANTTRNLAALTPIMMFPAVGAGKLWELVGIRRNPGGSEQLTVNSGQSPISRFPSLNLSISSLIPFLILACSAFITSRDYFVRWGEEPNVRAAYQQNLVQAVVWVNEHAAATHPIIFSTIYPGPAHDPSIAQVLMKNKAQPMRWMDARQGMIAPGNAAALLIIPSSTPIHPAFAPLIQEIDRGTLRLDDLDPFFTVYSLTPIIWPNPITPINFNDAIQLEGFTWGHNPVRTGDVVELITYWRVLDPMKVGLIVPPSFTTDMVFFTQILRSDGTVLAQQDRLDVPSWGWQRGDIVVQIHQLVIPGDAAAGNYQVIIGMYDRTSLQRTPVVNSTGTIIDDKATVNPLTVE